MPGLFVTATDTDVGKSILSACLLAAMSAAGESVSAYKPVLTGADEPPRDCGRPTTSCLPAVTGQSAEEVAPRALAQPCPLTSQPR